MEIQTFRAKTMQQALHLVREQLGPEATVLHTRELHANLLGRMLGRREFEIAASVELEVPSQLTAADSFQSSYAGQYQQDLQVADDDGLQELHVGLESGHGIPLHRETEYLPEALFDVYTDLIESDVEETIAQQYIERLQQTAGAVLTTAEYRELLEQYLSLEFTTANPIQASQGQGKVVALVGPTGVGKTTTIAKLAANYRLRENKRVGLITVDTYRIAAVEQLRTYAEIIDLPMEVVSTPREMREATARMGDLDLVLMDTAGRSPRDEVRIQELRAMLAEAKPAEVHLVVSAVGGARSLVNIAERFSKVGTSAMIVTKIDEAMTLGNLVTVSRNCELPISYLTDGQNVPDDIRLAKSTDIASLILN